MTRSHRSIVRILIAAMSLGTLGGPVRADDPVVDAGAIDTYMAERLEQDGYPSLSVGVVHGPELVFAKAYGVADRESGRPATTESLYYIGSITKVFTTTLMCILRDQGRVALDDPIAKYLPPSVKLPTDPRGAPAITLRHLATHTSGLPRLPPNLTPRGGDAYGAYSVEQLYAGLARVKLERPIGAECRYSNLGVGLLGHVLERAAGRPYEMLLRTELLEPLKMTDTRLTLSPAQQERLTTGYTGEDLKEKASPWDLGCLAGAGDLVSSVPDLAKFLSLQLRSGEAGVEPVAGGTLTELQTPQRLVGGWECAVGLGWHITPAEGLGDVVWHNGGVDGHFSFIGFVREPAVGVIVLANAGKPVDKIGWWLLVTAVDQAKRPAMHVGELPPAEKILDASIEATGGAEAHANVRSMIVHGKGTLSGIQVEFTEYSAAPGGYYLEMKMGPMTLMEEGTDGETAWEREAFGGYKLMTGPDRELALRSAAVDAELKWREQFKEARCTEVTDFENHRCYKVVMTAKHPPDETRYYDVDSRRLVGKETTLDMPPLGEQTIREFFDDYREFDGLFYPCRIAQQVAGIETEFVIERVAYNAEIPPERFRLPAAVRKLVDKKTATAPASSPR